VPPTSASDQVTSDFLPSVSTPTQPGPVGRDTTKHTADQGRSQTARQTCLCAVRSVMERDILVAFGFFTLL